MGKTWARYNYTYVVSGAAAMQALKNTTPSTAALASTAEPQHAKLCYPLHEHT